MKVLKTILRSFIVGLGIGVLVAPRAGSETRQLLSDRFNSIFEGPNQAAGQLDHSAAEGGTSAAFLPKQHYAESGMAREVNSTETQS